MLEVACMFSPGPFEKLEIAPWTFSPVATTPVILGNWVGPVAKVHFNTEFFKSNGTTPGVITES